MSRMRVHEEPVFLQTLRQNDVHGLLATPQRLVPSLRAEAMTFLIAIMRSIVRGNCPGE